MEQKNKQWLWVLIILIVLVLLVVILMALRGPSTPADVAVEVSEALAGEGSVRCTFRGDDTGANGVLYVKDGVIRSEVADATGATNIVVFDQESIYLWRDGEAQGFVFMQDGTTTVPPTSPNYIPTRGEIEASLQSSQVVCDGAVLTDGLFDVPSDVQFIPFDQATGVTQ